VKNLQQIVTNLSWHVNFIFVHQPTNVAWASPVRSDLSGGFRKSPRRNALRTGDKNRPQTHCGEVGRYQGSSVLAMVTVAASSRPWHRNCKKRLKSVAPRRFTEHFQIAFRFFARKRQIN